jgi:hypothetical protein
MVRAVSPLIRRFRFLNLLSLNLFYVKENPWVYGIWFLLMFQSSFVDLGEHMMLL